MEALLQGIDGALRLHIWAGKAARREDLRDARREGQAGQRDERPERDDPVAQRTASRPKR